MISLKKYTKTQLLNETKTRLNKIASVLDDEDLLDFIEESINYLNESMYNPRSYIFQPDDYVSYKGGNNFLDVTALKIDEVCNVYYSSKDQYNANFFFEELGLLPYISQGSGFANTLTEVTNFLIVQTNLNMMNRKMELCNDWELWPVDENGKEMLQMRSPGITRVEYLPHIDFSEEELYLFDHEWRMIKKLAFAKIMRHNFIIQSSAAILGVGSEANNLVQFWDTEVNKIQDDWRSHQIITYLQ